MNIKELCVGAVIASIYVVVTYLCAPLSYGGIQFRISEALVLICFYNKKYIIPLTIGCAIANILSPFGILDIVVGSSATLIALVLVSKCKNIFIASLMPVATSVIIGFELAIMNFDTYAFSLSNFDFLMFLLFSVQVAIGQFVCVSIVGVLLWKKLETKKDFMTLIEANQNIEEGI
ncbi:MAG: QueT transporter family protein [bacterium]